MNTFKSGFRAQFSGHETFPLRQLWLRKAYDAVAQGDGFASKAVFADEDAIVRFGVGKNMVSAIRFWATACKIIEERESAYAPTQLARFLLDADVGVDIFCERPATTWLMHWFLASTPDKTTTWYMLFNHVVQPVFDREHVVKQILGLAADREIKVSAATIKRDVECCVRSYVPRIGGESLEDMSEPLLGELGLVQQNTKGSFEFRRGLKRSLPDGVFAYALLDYWQRLEHSGSVMAFDRVAHDYGSPGRVFKLDENSVAERLASLESLSNGLIQWTEQAGIRQVTRLGRALDDIEGTKLKLLKTAYAKR
jgi:hypothetical protein